MNDTTEKLIMQDLRGNVLDVIDASIEGKLTDDHLFRIETYRDMLSGVVDAPKRAVAKMKELA